MDGKPIVMQFQDDIDSLVDKYRSQGVTLGEMIGTFEIVKLNLWNESIHEGEEEET
jgi:hypothetical protein